MQMFRTGSSSIVGMLVLALVCLKIRPQQAETISLHAQEVYKCSSAARQATIRASDDGLNNTGAQQ